MNENKEEKGQVATQSEQATRDSSERVDWFLQTLVGLANSWNLIIGITLNVGGTLISGDLVSGRGYFEDFAKNFVDGFVAGVKGVDPETVSAMEGSLKKLADMYPDRTVEKKKEEEEAEEEALHTTDRPTYIHLRDARIYHPAGAPIPANQGVWWRGRLEAVDGFFLGRIFTE